MPNTILEGLLAQKGYGKDKRPDLKGYDNRQMIEQVYKYRSHLNAYQYAFVSKIHRFIEDTLEKPGNKFLPAERNDVYDKMAAVLNAVISDDLNRNAPDDRYPSDVNLIDATIAIGDFELFEPVIGQNVKVSQAKSKLVKDLGQELAGLTVTTSGVPAALDSIAKARKELADKSKNVAMKSVKTVEDPFRTTKAYTDFIKLCDERLSSDELPQEQKEVISKCRATAQRLATLEYISDNEHKGRYLPIMREIVANIDKPHLSFWREVEYAGGSLFKTSKAVKTATDTLEKGDAILLKNYTRLVGEDDARRLKGNLEIVRTAEGQVLNSVNHGLNDISLSTIAAVGVETERRQKYEQQLRNRIDKVDPSDVDYVKMLGGVVNYLRALRHLKPDPEMAKGLKVTETCQIFRDTMRYSFLKNINAVMDNYQIMRASIHDDKASFDRKHKDLELSLMAAMGSVSDHMDFAAKLTKNSESFDDNFDKLRGEFLELLNKIKAEKKKRDEIYDRQEKALGQSMRSYQDEREKILREMPEDKNSTEAKILQDELDRHFEDRRRKDEKFEADYNREIQIREEAKKLITAAQAGDFSELIDRQFIRKNGEEPEPCKRALEVIFKDEKLRSAYAAELTQRRAASRARLAEQAETLMDNVRNKTYGEIGVLGDDAKAVRTIANIVATTYHEDRLAKGHKDAVSPRRYDELVKAVPNLAQAADADAASPDEDAEVRANTTAKAVGDGVVSITVDPEFLERRRQQALREQTQRRLMDKSNGSIQDYIDEEARIKAEAKNAEGTVDRAILEEEVEKAFDTYVKKTGREEAYENEQTARRETDEYLAMARENEFGVLIDSMAGKEEADYPESTKRALAAIRDDENLNRGLEAALLARHQERVRGQYLTELQRELGYEQDLMKTAKGVMDRRAALGAGNDEDDKLRSEVLDQFEADLKQKQPDYEKAYYRTEKLPGIMERLQKSFADNDPEAYEKAADEVRTDAGKDQMLGGDFAQECISSFENGLAQEQRKLLDGYRAEMRRRQALREEAQGRLEEAAKKSMQDYIDVEEQLRTDGEYSDYQVDRQILDEEIRKAYEANIKKAGREQEYVRAYERLEKKLGILERLQKSFGNNDPAAYVNEMEKLRQQSVMQGEQERDLAEECIKEFENSLGEDRRKALSDYREQVRIEQERIEQERIKQERIKQERIERANQENAHTREKLAEQIQMSVRERKLADIQEERDRLDEFKRRRQEQQNNNEHQNNNEQQNNIEQQENVELQQNGEPQNAQPQNAQQPIRPLEEFCTAKTNYVLNAAVDEELKDLSDLFLTKKNTVLLFFNKDTGTYTNAKNALQNYLNLRNNIRNEIRSAYANNYSQNHMTEDEFRDYVTAAEQTLAVAEQSFKDTMKAYYVHATNGRDNTLGNARIDTKTQAAGAARFAASKGFLEFLDAAEHAAQPAAQPAEQPVNDAQRVKETDFRQLFKETLHELNGAQEVDEATKARNRVRAADRAKSTLKRRRWQHQNDNQGPAQQH